MNESLLLSYWVAHLRHHPGRLARGDNDTGTGSHLIPVTHPAFRHLNLTMDDSLNPEGCGEPKTKLAFAKTHKTGSRLLLWMVLVLSVALAMLMRCGRCCYCSSIVYKSGPKQQDPVHMHSTVMDILLRYALSQELNVVLPDHPSPTALYSKNKFKWWRDYAYPPWHAKLKNRGLYDIFTMHTRFSVEAMQLSTKHPWKQEQTLFRNPGGDAHLE